MLYNAGDYNLGSEGSNSLRPVLNRLQPCYLRANHRQFHVISARAANDSCYIRLVILGLQ